ncbi:MAG: DUF5522 domain-containing protein [Acidimicrobiales bacterium]
MGRDRRSAPVGQPIADRPLTEPHRARLSPSHPAYREILAAHAAALRQGWTTYIDPPSGLSVLTAGYLQARGSCCQIGCRHCPYLV